MISRGLGADRVDLRIGYASLAVTLSAGELVWPVVRRTIPEDELRIRVFERTARVEDRAREAK